MHERPIVLRRCAAVILLGALGALQSISAQELPADVDGDASYAPDCDPSQMTLDQRDPPYRTFPRPCAVYYYPYPEGTRFSSQHYWGATGWFTIGSGVSDLFFRAPWRFRQPAPAVPAGFFFRTPMIYPAAVGRPTSGPGAMTAARLRAPTTARVTGRPDAVARRPSVVRPDSRYQRDTATSRHRAPDRPAAAAPSRAPWAAAAQRNTNPQGWRYGGQARGAPSGRSYRGGASADSASSGAMSRNRAASGSRSSVRRSAGSASRSSVHRSTQSATRPPSRPSGSGGYRTRRQRHR